MANTTVHGGLDESITSQLQFTSQMSNFASTIHSHTSYVNISQIGSMYFVNGANITFSSNIIGNSTTVSAFVNAGSQIQPNNIIFLNSHGHTFGSSINAGTTFYWVKTN